VVKLLLDAVADNFNDPVLPTAVPYTVVTYDVDGNTYDTMLPDEAIYSSAALNALERVIPVKSHIPNRSEVTCHDETTKQTGG
jgi:hypothetical protein